MGYYDYKKDHYIYQYKDHLGNVRVSFGKNSAGALEITDANDYYPFGMNHLKTGNAFFGVGSYKNYKYNGKELQETGMYDYGARMYMPDLGRWGVVDPLAEKYFNISPFNYTANNPILFIDPKGMNPVYNWSTGKYMDGTQEVSFGQAMNSYGLNSDGSDCPKCKKTKEDGRKMISSARATGLNFAADNMEYFLNGKDRWSNDKKISSKFLKSNSSVRHATALNVAKLFNKKFGQQLDNMKLGETITLKGTWKDSYYASANELDLLYGSGGYTITTNVSVQVTRGKLSGLNGYTFSGDIDVSYFDTYNWDAGKGDYVPGFGYTDDSNFDDLVENGQAANFNMTSSWNINVSDWGYLSGGVKAGIINTIMQSR
ncbi:RHS repeat-associated core domain-containing protein [Chryseobacterium joostei]|uniref:RHS repeat-associated core domain-containing protein n=1 Tax=Chryseobacterium joostei TaxID=112234 RepID=A0A1N7IFW4_9FLAO|nr:RHS repeat-associated core domain-containing protein [Chryseobacterium joostei]SIS35983.1 RHS repeat-associated core domain-containing protein [Chryseobacterium joostei]